MNQARPRHLRLLLTSALCLLAASVALGAPEVSIDLYAYSIHATENKNKFDALEKQWLDFSNQFSELVQKHCGFDLSFKLHDLQKLEPTTKQTELIFDERPADKDLYAKYKESFRYFQYPLARLLSQHPQIANPPGSLAILFVDNLQHHCAYALPKSQFCEASACALPDELISQLVNFVLIGFKTEDPTCRPNSRMLAHEFAHIFVQDEPAHTMKLSESSKPVPCPESNLLATLQETAPKPWKRRRANDDDSDFEPATGTELNAQQCAAIRQTADDLLKQVKERATPSRP